MKPTGTAINTSNLQEFLDSASNAADLGQRQFFTPLDLAANLCRPLPAVVKELIMDFHFGSGAIAIASEAKNALGLDIDARSADEVEAPEDAVWTVEQADLTHWYPLAAEAGFTAPFILINPPFSLRWYSDRLAPLRQSTIPEIAETIAAHPEWIDSTLASFLIALDLLSTQGEGLMICNASTARRFFGDPADPLAKAPHASLRKFIWLWLEIPGASFENLQHPFDTAVIYFSRSHGMRADHQPLFLTSPATAPEAVLQTLCNSEVFHAHRGERIRYAHEVNVAGTLARFATVNQEYRLRHRGRKPDWNISLDQKGLIHTYLTPFQKVSKRLDRKLVERLNSLSGHSPVQLCVTATSRTMLREAAQCGVWRIHPDVQTAIDLALVEYDRDGAPFYQPSSTQALGWVDEFGELTCSAAGIGSCLPGDRCRIESSMEKTVWTGNKVNLAGEPETLEFSGEELLVVLMDPDGSKHHFHVRRDEKEHKDVEDKATGKVLIRHHTIAALIEHFHIPIPKDLATLRPEAYQENLAALDDIEAMVNSNLARHAAAA